MEVNFADLQREHDAAAVSLGLVFGAEYSHLPASTDIVNVTKDFILAFREDGCTTDTECALLCPINDTQCDGGPQS